MIQLALNPFVRFGGWISIVIGLAVVMITAVLAYLAQVHLDGVIDLHANGKITGPALPFSLQVCMVEGFVNWFSLSLSLALSGYLLTRSRIRFIDILGTQGMARFPFLLAVVFSVFFSDEKMLQFIQYKYLHQGEAVELGLWDMISFGLQALLILACLVWMIVLMYRAYSVSCNLKGNKSVIAFIVSLLFAEVLSKLLISWYLGA